MIEPLKRLDPGMPIVFGGDRLTKVPAELAEAFAEGDRLVVVQSDGALLHIPAVEWEIAAAAVTQAHTAFASMGTVTDDQLETFYTSFAAHLEDDTAFAPIVEANSADTEAAVSRGRSTTRLALTDRMREGMVEGLRSWAKMDTGRGRVVERIDHGRWSLSQIKVGLGVVGFVFEGRPNVFADATGVLASGNTVVFRIGSDALGTARAIMEHALNPALAESGLPPGTVSLVDSPSHAAGWAMFSDPRLALAVARGSGPAVAQLGAVARQSGIPVSLHGTGGAWIIAAEDADAETFGLAVYHSLDRKVCNTLNTACVVEERADDLIPVFLAALERSGARRGAASKLHVTRRARSHIPDVWFEETVISRAGGPVAEPRAELIGDDELGREWEWEESPEVTLAVVTDVPHAVSLFNAQSPRFAASLISSRDEAHEAFFDEIDAPFVGNGFTRWVDGQYALNRPELGLSNWQYGRLFGRGGVLSGDSVFAIKARVVQDEPDIGR